MSELILVCRPRESYASRPAWQRDETKRSNKSCNNHRRLFPACTLPPLYFFFFVSPPLVSLISSLSFFFSLCFSSLYPRQRRRWEFGQLGWRLVLPINRVNCSQHPRNCATCALIYCTTLLWPCAEPAIINGGHKPRSTHRSPRPRKRLPLLFPF